MFLKYRELGESILDLLEYLDFNVNSLRKIIRRHDCLFDQKMGSMYFDTRIGRNPQNSQLVQLYHQEGVRAIIGTLRRGFEDLYDAKNALLDRSDDVFPFNNSVSTTIPMLRQPDIPRISYRNRLASFSCDTEGGLATSRNPRTDRLHARSRNRSTNHLFSMLSTDNLRKLPGAMFQKRSPNGVAGLKRSISDLEPILKRIGDVANRVMLSQNQSTSEYMATHSIMALDFANSELQEEAVTGEEEAREPKPKKTTSSVGLYLNLFVTFLYMANQYVVAPSSGHYGKPSSLPFVSFTISFKYKPTNWQRIS
jgi:hypothetical protein